jgi:branched-chain amino acid aminotransferase/4-amino-4-deoxychorismate lyase
VLARAGALVLWDRHMNRLARGCAALGLPAPNPAECERTACEALAAGGLNDQRAAVRVTWTAGAGGRGLDRPEPPSPRLIVGAVQTPVLSSPIRLATASVRRNPSSPTSRLKTLAYLDQVLARNEARAAGADEAVMLSTDGRVACAAAANLFWVRGSELFTPALECGVLDGCMRGLLIERLGAHEVAAGPDVLADADAVFVTSSLVGVRPASSLDGRALSDHPFIARAREAVADAA